MRKLIVILVAFSLVVFCTGLVKAQKKAEQKGVTKGQQEQARKDIKRVYQIRKQMREIQKNTISNDKELNKLKTKIQNLGEKVRKMLQAKLEDNQEYQDLKKELQSINSKLQKMRGQGSSK